MQMGIYSIYKRQLHIGRRFTHLLTYLVDKHLHLCPVKCKFTIRAFEINEVLKQPSCRTTEMEVVFPKQMME